MEQMKYAAKMHLCPSCKQYVRYDDLVFAYPEPDAPHQCVACHEEAGKFFHSLLEFMSYPEARAELLRVFPESV